MSRPAVYFNDNEKFVCDWLTNLYPEATVDCRSVTELSAMNPWLDESTRVHLFAGIGGWEYALQLAGWPDNLPVWTGSCPCQPFSTAGKRKGTEDARHLWPEMLRLISECRPPVIFGEQVASKDGRLWLAGVRADLEALGYAVGAADISAAGVGAPHIRQRLYWCASRLADTGRIGHESGREFGEFSSSPERAQEALQEWQRSRDAAGDSEPVGRVANASGVRREQWGRGPTTTVQGERTERGGEHPQPGDDGELPGRPQGLRGPGGLANSENSNRGWTNSQADSGRGLEEARGSSAVSYWSDYELVDCLDGKTRRVGSGIQPLANGVSARVGKLRAAGNSIVPQVAAEFIAASMEVMGL